MKAGGRAFVKLKAVEAKTQAEAEKGLAGPELTLSYRAWRGRGAPAGGEWDPHKKS